MPTTKEDKFDIVLKEVPAGEGLTIDEITELAKAIDGDLIETITIDSIIHPSAAMGFLSSKTAEAMSYDYDELERFVRRILDDTDLESENETYEFECNDEWSTMFLTR